jgi:hypothetical protein
MMGGEGHPQARAVAFDPPERSGPRAAAGARVIRRRTSEYLRSPIFWAMMISAPIVWALALFVIARIFHAALS